MDSTPTSTWDSVYTHQPWPTWYSTWTDIYWHANHILLIAIISLANFLKEFLHAYIVLAYWYILRVFTGFDLHT